MSLPYVSLCWISRRFCIVDCSSKLATIFISKSATIDPLGFASSAIVVIVQVYDREMEVETYWPAHLQ